MKITLALLMGMTISTASFGQFFYAGTYTDGTSKGVYGYELDAKTGKLQPLGLMAKSVSPAFLAWHPTKKFLYAVNEAGAGNVTAFSVDSKTHKLTELNRQSSMGEGPCHLTVDHTGKALIVANYGAGSVVSYPIGADGKLGAAASVVQHTGKGIDPQKQDGPHAHSAYLSKDNKYVYVADLGLDKVFRYALDTATAKLTAAEPGSFAVKPGYGPRHMAFAADGKHAYVINEMGNKVTVFNYDAKAGTMSEFADVSTLPPNFVGQNTTAEIALSPGGKFLYASNRGHDSIAVFAVGGGGAELKLVENVPSGGAMPRNFALTPKGDFLLAANQKGNNIVVFRVDAKTGKLKATGETAELGAPVCLLF